MSAFTSMPSLVWKVMQIVHGLASFRFLGPGVVLHENRDSKTSV